MARTSPFQAFGLVALGLGLFAVLLALVEGLFALAGWGDETRHADPWVGFAPGAALFLPVEEDGERRFRTAPAKLGFFNDQSFARDRPEGGLRIFALGGSTTAGRPYDAAVAFPAWLERWLRLAEPDRPVEVVNAGAISYASYRIALLEKELLRHRPDAFLLYTGHNEFLEERTYGSLRRRPAALRRLGGWLGGLRTFSLVRAGLAPAPSEILPAEVTARLDDPRGLDSYHRDPDLERSVVAHFEDNLRRIVAIARDAGVEIVAVRPASNLRDFSPFKSEVRDGVGAAGRARLADLLAAAERQLGAGLAAEASARLAEAEAIDPDFARLRFLAGRLALVENRPEDARREFVAARDLDVAPLRATSAILAAFDRVVADLEVPSIDLPSRLAAQLRERGLPPVPGDDLFLDHVHPRIEIHAEIATEIHAILAERGLVEVGPAGLESRRREVLDRVTAELDPAYVARRDLNLAKVLGWAGKLDEAAEPLARAAAVLDTEPEVHLNLGILALRAGRLEEARRALERARELDPELPPTHYNLGVALGRLGEPAAGAASLRRALELRPDWVAARINLANLERRAGDLQAAAAAAEAALRLAPDDPDAIRAAARVKAAEGAADAALDQLERAAEGHAGHSGIALDRVDLLLDAGRDADAERVLEALLDRRLDAEAAFRLGSLRSRRGDAAGAESAYRLALGSDPHHARALTNLGIALSSRGEHGEALALLGRAADRAPESADAWLNLGVALDRAGRPADAVAALERAVAADPSAERPRAALELLRRALADAAP